MTEPDNALSIIEYFSIIKDPREASGQRHALADILVITLCGIICGVDNWVEMERFGRVKEAWFGTFLPLEHGIPSHDTMSRVVGALDPEAFQLCFIRWVKSLARLIPGAVVALDGKTVRNSFDRASGRSAIHLVSAWATEAGLCLGQVKTSEKSNEITAIPELLLHLKGCIVTTDAMGCQKDIAGAVVVAGADYALQVKDNQPTLRGEIEEYFASMPSPDKVLRVCTLDQDHGRLEERTYYHTHDIDWFADKQKWPGLTGFATVERKRTLLLDAKTSTERHFYITSFARENRPTRQHSPLPTTAWLLRRRSRKPSPSAR